MIKRTIEISSGPARLSVRQGQLLIDREGQEPASVPCEDIGVLIIDHPAVSYTHGALVTLLENKAAVVVCGKLHLPEGIMLPCSGNELQGERLRSQVNAPVPVRKNLWKQIVQAKIRHQAMVLGKDHPVHGKLTVLAAGVKSDDSGNHEAQASRAYWPAVFPEDKFRRNPEGDAPNNFLNYGYAILRTAVARAICGAGLHPSIGIHHRNRYDAYALADDLMEPFRPMIDLRVRGLWDRGKVELDREAKAHLLAFMTDPVTGGNTTGPFMVALPRMLASFCRCLTKEDKDLEIPTPCFSPVTGPCGS